MASADASSLSIAAFTALGTVVGYLGTEVASASIFHRILWPSRFYNDSRTLKSFIGIIFLMPIGGPIHKAAVEVLNSFSLAGLWKGYCRGDMLGTAFYDNTGHSYVVRMANSNINAKKEARNAFWVTVLSLIPWKPRPNQGIPPAPADDESAARIVHSARAQRPVFTLKLSRATPTVTKTLTVVDGDIGPLKFRYLMAILASEFVTLAVGIINAAIWHSMFAIWYLAPLLLKITALLFHVRRNSINALQHQTTLSTPGTSEAEQKFSSTTNGSKGHDMMLCQIEGFSKGFFLIEGPSELLLQFFRHYGHPERHRKGGFGDRAREVISMFTVIGAILIYPAGLIAFIFAPITIQWVWLGYQLYAMLAMHIYRFGECEHIGTTQAWIARELLHHGSVSFDDGSGNRVVAELQSSTARSIADGQQEVERLVERLLEVHTQNDG